MIVLEKHIFQNAGINILDVIVILIFLFCIISGYKNGLIHTLFDLISFFISTIISIKIYPVVSNFLKSTFIFDIIKSNIFKNMKEDSIINTQNKNIQLEFIDSLPIPDIFSNVLKQNNNSNIYKLFNINSLKDYISIYFTNIICNVISCIIVFILVFITMKVISRSLDLVAKFPVINIFNKSGGLLIGVIKGLLFVWLGCILYTLFFINLSSKEIDLMLDSKFAIYFYENNLILKYITKIFK